METNPSPQLPPHSLSTFCVLTPSGSFWNYLITHLAGGCWSHREALKWSSLYLRSVRGLCHSLTCSYTQMHTHRYSNIYRCFYTFLHYSWPSFCHQMGKNSDSKQGKVTAFPMPWSCLNYKIFLVNIYA